MAPTSQQQTRTARRKPDPTDVEPRLYGVPASAIWLGISQAQVWRLLETGELASLKIGRRRLIPLEALEAFVASAQTAS